MCDQCSLRPSVAEEMPRPTVELELMDKAIRAFCEAAPPKMRRRFLRSLFDQLAEEDGDNVIPFRDRARIALEHEKQRGAVAWARSRLPAWMIGDRA